MGIARRICGISIMTVPVVIGANGFPVRNTSNSRGNATEVLGGIRNTLSYKGVTFSFLIDARWGIDQYDQFKQHCQPSVKGIFENRERRGGIQRRTGRWHPKHKEVFLRSGDGPDGSTMDKDSIGLPPTTSEYFVKDPLCETEKCQSSLITSTTLIGNAFQA